MSRTFTIRNARTGAILYKQNAACFSACLEQAIEKKICLDHADLRNCNLINANMDNAQLDHADFTNANLAGANLSEAQLKGARFSNTTLYDTCLAYSCLRSANFEDAFFGATDITGADISHSSFSTLSCFTLDFVHADSMQRCIFKNPDGRLSEMSHPPIVIKGLPKTLIFLDRHVKVEHDVYDSAKWVPFIKTALPLKPGGGKTTVG